jgi:ferredoxin
MKTRYDERNIIFSRVKLEKNTEAYDTYYKNHPEIKEKDDSLRGFNIRTKLRESEEYKALFFPLTSSNKALLKHLHTVVDETPLANRVIPPKDFHKNIKEITKHYGAYDVGIVKLNEDHYYSHSGGLSTSIGIDNYGEKIKPTYTHAIVYIIPMDLEFINRAPNYEEMIETENVYLNIAFTGSRLALYLKGLGYKTTFQSEAFYLTPLVPLAFDAGLGEIGMTNHLVHPELGDRFRIGAVLTTLQLEADKPMEFGLEDFCKRCALCVMNCPSKSITPFPRMVNGRRFYKFDDQSCFNLWKNTGTDCGTCIQSCPFTQGIDLKTVLWMKNDQEKIDQVLKDHLKKHTRRRYTKDPLDIVNIEGGKKS